MQSFTLKLQAFDGIFSAETTVQVTVRDVNDNKPEFQPKETIVNGVVEEDDSVTLGNPKFLATVSSLTKNTG